VLFAESDDELDEVAGGLLARSLAAGDVVIVLATADHRRLFDDQMKAAGVDLDRARREGMLIALDAAETLERLTPRGAFDLGAFDEVVGELVRSASARGAVQAFGEIVGLLWDLGRVEEAIELEAAWNLLLEESGASLVCAYPSMVVDPQSTHSVLTVCALHSSVLDSAPFARVWHFPAELATVSAARRQVVTALRARGLSGVTLQDVEVAVAELVANAVLHGRSACSVKVELDGDRVRVEVADRNPHLPLPRAVDREASSGRGLHLLSALTDSWGSHMAPQGKVVWTELAR
jgi:anti-sigma regulatory factor (Ser/Thr protein kinase)